MTLQQQNQKLESMIREFQSLRKMQKDYFKYRDRDTLQKCKIQERKVDQLIKDHYAPKLL